MLQKIINLLRRKMKIQFLKRKLHHYLLLKLLMEHHQQVNTKCINFHFIVFCIFLYYIYVIEWVEAEKKIIDNKVKTDKRPIKIPNNEKIKLVLKS